MILPAHAEGNEPESVGSRLMRNTGRGVFFGSFDAAGRDRFIGWGFKYAPTGRLDTPGWRFLTTTGVKLRDADPASAIRYNRVDVVRAMAGHEWRFGGSSLTAYVGGSFALHSPDTAGVLRRRGRLGPAGMLELWHDWGEQNAYTFRATSLTLIADQTTRSLYLRARHGFAIPRFYGSFGPEFALSAGATIRSRAVTLQGEWRKARLGLHISEIPLWRLTLGASAGGEFRQRGRTGAYANIGAYISY